MNVSNGPSIVTISSNVWGFVPRVVTALGSTTFILAGASRAAVANGTTTTLQPAAGRGGTGIILGIGLTNVTWAMNLTNGVNTDPWVSGASGAGVVAQFTYNSNFYISITNSGTVSGNFNYSAVQFQQ